MSKLQCDKCGEMVPAAKAFCPGCGEPFVEEQKRTTTSEFESVDHTQRMGQTMYNQMLSDMGLNISKQPNAPGKPEKQVSVIAPAAALTPSVPTQPIKAAPAAPPPTTSSNNYLKWIIIAVAGLILLGAIVVIVAAVLVFWLSGRT
jgi:hypothetical protein